MSEIKRVEYRGVRINISKDGYLGYDYMFGANDRFSGEFKNFVGGAQSYADCLSEAKRRVRENQASRW